MADFLSDEEQAERLQKLWREYGLILVLALAIGIGAVIGWNAYQKSSLQTKEDAAYQFQDFLVERALGGDLDAFLAEMGKSGATAKYVPWALLYRAKDAVEADDYESALQFLQEALGKTRDNAFKDLMLVRIARVQMQLQQDDAALLTLAEVGEDHQAFVSELKGDIYVAAEDYDEAYSAYALAMELVTSGLNRERLEMKMVLIPRPDSTDDLSTITP